MITADALRKKKRKSFSGETMKRFRGKSGASDTAAMSAVLIRAEPRLYQPANDSYSPRPASPAKRRQPRRDRPGDEELRADRVGGGLSKPRAARGAGDAPAGGEVGRAAGERSKSGDAERGGRRLH